MLGQKKTWLKNILGPKKRLVKNKFGVKKFGRQKCMSKTIMTEIF